MTQIPLFLAAVAGTEPSDQRFNLTATTMEWMKILGIVGVVVLLVVVGGSDTGRNFTASATIYVPGALPPLWTATTCCPALKL